MLGSKSVGVRAGPGTGRVEAVRAERCGEQAETKKECVGFDRLVSKKK